MRFFLKRTRTRRDVFGPGEEAGVAVAWGSRITPEIGVNLVKDEGGARIFPVLGGWP